MSELGFMLQPGQRREPLAIASFPMLQHQVRCGTGFTHARGGVLSVKAAVFWEFPPEPVAAPVVVDGLDGQPDDPLALERGARQAAMLDVLHLVADSGFPLPNTADLARAAGIGGHAAVMGALTLQQLHSRRVIRMESLSKGQGRATLRRITLRDGRVVQSEDWEG